MASGVQAIRTYDPLQRDMELPLRGVFHPLGFRLNLFTNSRDVLDAAEESWGSFRPAFHRPPVQLEIVVSPEGTLVTDLPRFRSRGDLFSVVYDRDNFGMYHSKSMSGYCFVSQATAETHIRLRVHFLEAMTYMLLAQNYAVPVHAACVERNGSGVLLFGVSGAGKSTLSFACARAGWTFLSDDAAWLPRDARDRLAIGRPHHARFRDDAPRFFPELAGYAARTRPNGKLTIEAPLADFPEIRTATECIVDALVMIDRREGAPARLEPLSSAGAVERLLQDLPSYGPEVNAWHDETISTLAGARAYRLQYSDLSEAVALLATIVQRGAA